MITISLCMIVKNEECVLARCLDSVCDLMDEIIVVDTGSTDKTKEIASRYTDKIYDYTWMNDFSDARNFSFSKATMDYIYAPDADELLDEENRERFRTLKACMLPEIEIVQMKYVTELPNDAVMNVKKEYRPKLFKRLRTFTWIDPVHETVRLDPVVFDSDVEIMHRPVSTHEKRDYTIFVEELKRRGTLSPKLRNMYARELLKLGELQDLTVARPYFLTLWEENPVNEAGREAACILARLARIEGNVTELLKYALRDMLEKPCAEICYELGLHFFAQQDYQEAIIWFMNASEETQSVLDIHTEGDLPLLGLADCYGRLICELENDMDVTAENDDSVRSTEDIAAHGTGGLLASYRELECRYRQAAAAWTVPEIL